MPGRSRRRHRGRLRDAGPGDRATIGPVRSASTTSVRRGCRASARASVSTSVVRPSARWQLVKSKTLRPCRSCTSSRSRRHLFKPIAPLSLEGQYERRPLQLGRRSRRGRRRRPGERRFEGAGRPVRGRRNALRRIARLVLGIRPCQCLVNFPHAWSPRGCRRATHSRGRSPGPRCRCRGPSPPVRSRGRPPRANRRRRIADRPAGSRRAGADRPSPMVGAVASAIEQARTRAGRLDQPSVQAEKSGARTRRAQPAMRTSRRSRRLRACTATAAALSDARQPSRGTGWTVASGCPSLPALRSATPANA